MHTHTVKLSKRMWPVPVKLNDSSKLSLLKQNYYTQTKNESYIKSSDNE